MYTKEELEAMDIPQLMGIANELGVKVKQSDDLETVVYAILDKAAEESASPKRKRTRMLKKDTNRVYTVKGKEGENFDPNLHEAVMHVEDESFGEQQIAQVFQKGYTCKGKVLSSADPIRAGHIRRHRLRLVWL